MVRRLGHGGMILHFPCCHRIGKCTAKFASAAIACGPDTGRRSIMSLEESSLYSSPALSRSFPCFQTVFNRENGSDVVTGAIAHHFPNRSLMTACFKSMQEPHALSAVGVQRFCYAPHTFRPTPSREQPQHKSRHGCLEDGQPGHHGRKALARAVKMPRRDVHLHAHQPVQ